MVSGEWRVSAAGCSASFEVLRSAPGLDSPPPYCRSPGLRRSTFVSPTRPEILPHAKGTVRTLQKCDATVLRRYWTARKRPPVAVGSPTRIVHPEGNASDDRYPLLRSYSSARPGDPCSS